MNQLTIPTGREALVADATTTITAIADDAAHTKQQTITITYPTSDGTTRTVRKRGYRVGNFAATLPLSKGDRSVHGPTWGVTLLDSGMGISPVRLPNPTHAAILVHALAATFGETITTAELAANADAEDTVGALTFAAAEVQL
jgi:hypothetical protein